MLELLCSDDTRSHLFHCNSTSFITQFDCFLQWQSLYKPYRESCKKCVTSSCNIYKVFFMSMSRKMMDSSLVCNKRRSLLRSCDYKICMIFLYKLHSFKLNLFIFIGNIFSYHLTKLFKVWLQQKHSPKHFCIFWLRINQDRRSYLLCSRLDKRNKLSIYGSLRIV